MILLDSNKVLTREANNKRDLWILFCKTIILKKFDIAREFTIDKG